MLRRCLGEEGHHLDKIEAAFEPLANGQTWLAHLQPSGCFRPLPRVFERASDGTSEWGCSKVYGAPAKVRRTVLVRLVHTEVVPDQGSRRIIHTHHLLHSG